MNRHLEKSFFVFKSLHITPHDFSFNPKFIGGDRRPV